MITNKVQDTYKIDGFYNPFPGLRAFGVEESHLFFGREGQSEIILEYLAQNRFAAVTGASGSGKSSLIYCGLVPLLYGGFIIGAGSNWRVLATRPGNQPVKNLAEAIADCEINADVTPGTNHSELTHNIAYALLRRSSYGLVEAVSQMKLKKGENLLLVIDQFEELFRFKESRVDTNTTINETEAFIKLLVNAVYQRKLPIYIVLTMRSDFIGECSQFQQLTKLINQSNFLVPQMTREDFSQAIFGPVAVADKKIDSLLIQQVLNSIIEGSDQLPVLQHAMMRTWDFWKKYNEPGTPLRLRDYEAAGKLENALSLHANEAYESLTDEGKRICKSMFRTLTEQSTDNKGVRHPATIKEIAEVAQSSYDEVKVVVEEFRSHGRSFLTPAENIPLEENTVIDISHESLMRVWDRLKGWVEEETASVQMYLRLSEAASMFQLGKTGLWRPPDLHLAINWRKSQHPSLAWAKKYNPAFEKVMVFLDTSEKKFLQEEQNKVKLQRRTLSRTRRFASIMGTMALALVALVIYAYIQWNIADKLRKQAEIYAINMEDQKDDAVEETNIKEIERLRAMYARDSAEKSQMQALFQLREVKEEASEAYDKVDQVTKISLEFQKTSEQARIEKQQAELAAQQAFQDQSKAEKDKAIELKKRLLTTAQNIAVKSRQVSDKNIKGVLALQAYQFNKEYLGSDYSSDIYIALYHALEEFKGAGYNTIKGHEEGIRSLVYMPNKNSFFSAGLDGKVIRWDMDDNNNYSHVLINNSSPNRSLAISSNGRWLACGTGSSSIQLFNLKQPNSQPQYLEGHQGWVVELDFVPNRDVLISCSEDKSIRYWDLLSHENRIIVTNNVRIRAICVTRDGKYVFGGTDDGKLVRWSIDNGDATTLYDNGGISIFALSTNSTGSRLAIADKSGFLILFNTSTGKIISKVRAHSARVQDINYSPDNNQIASSSYDGTIKIWNAGDLTERPITITEHESWVSSVAFSPDGKTLISCSNNSDIIFYWQTNSGDMANQLCRYISRNLTNQEWGFYIGPDIDYRKTCVEKN